MVKGSSSSSSGAKAKSVSFGVVLTQSHKVQKEQSCKNSIISETSSVDLIDGAKMSSLKRKSIIKSPSPQKDEQKKKKEQKVRPCTLR